MLHVGLSQGGSGTEALRHVVIFPPKRRRINSRLSMPVDSTSHVACVLHKELTDVAPGGYPCQNRCQTGPTCNFAGWLLMCAVALSPRPVARILGLPGHCPSHPGRARKDWNVVLIHQM